jgi:hypothetical protein
VIAKVGGLTMHIIDFAVQAPVDESVWSAEKDYFGVWERITQLPCYVCSGYNAETAPLRQVGGKGIGKGPDPTEYFILSCGHKVI